MEFSHAKYLDGNQKNHLLLAWDESILMLYESEVGSERKYLGHVMLGKNKEPMVDQ